MRPDIPNREGHPDYDVVWPWNPARLGDVGRLRPGLTCVFRVRNEARNLPWVLPPMLAAVQQVLLVDNGSDDGTPDVARRVAEEAGAADRLTVRSYPWRVSRAGAEHLATPADSVHSLTHFYNWSFSHVETAYSMKWDGDMVLTAEGVDTLRDLSWQLEGSGAVVLVPRHPLTVESERVGWLDLATRFLEPWIYPMSPDHTFVKAFEWEVREFPATAERIVLPEGLCVEVKWLDADEFAHWTDTAAFNAARSPRKQREWEVYTALRDGRGDRLPGLVRVEAPRGEHIIDHVTGRWLPAAPRPLVRRGGRASGVSVPGPGGVPAESPQAAAQAGSGQAGPGQAGPGQAGPGQAGSGQGGGAQGGGAQTAGRAEGGDRPDDGAPRRGRAASGVWALFDEATEPLLVLVHQRLAGYVDRLPESATVVVLPAATVPVENRWGTIVLMVPDRDALRRTVPALPPTRGTRVVAVWVGSLDRALTLAPRADWPPMLQLSSRRARNGQGFALVRFANALPGREVLAEIGRQSVMHDTAGHRGLRVAVHGDAPVPPGDVNARRLARIEDAGDQDVDVPPDVVLTSGPRDVALPEHHVTGRAPLVVDDRSGTLAIGPLDERILNPTGFLRAAEAPVAEMDAGWAVVRLGEQTLDLRSGSAEQLVASLRPAAGLRLSWPGEPDLPLARTVAGLAMAGIPLVGSEPPAWAGDMLGGPVVEAVTTPVDLDDELAREEHSIVLRRAALNTFSSFAWRATLGTAAGVRVATHPTVSICLATKRRDQLDFTLTQVRKQRGIDVELVLAPHGFEVDAGQVRELVGPHVSLVLRPQPEATLFGDVLAEAVASADGDVVLKMDDDDWYSPDFVTDLLLARAYSGADLVGMPAEFLYLAPLGVTVRRNDPSEFYAKFVAGGTMMIDRSLLRSMGSFRPVRRFVDASLLSDVVGAGASAYRTQGLGYLFRRGDSGHTWEAGLEFFLDPERLAHRWDGFHPSRLLEYDASELPR